MMQELKAYIRLIIEQMSRADKKAAKKAYLRSQVSSEVPSFEEIWGEIEGSDSVSHEVDELKMVYQDEYAESIGVHPEDVSFNDTAFIQWITDNVIKGDVEGRYLEVVYAYQRAEGDHCWRGIELPEGADPVTHPQLGIYWSTEPSGAAAYWGDLRDDLEHIYKAKIDPENIDWKGTLIQRVKPGMGENESEIRFIQNSKIWVESVMLPDGTEVPINDWRLV